MPTIQQLVTKGRQDKTTKSKSPALGYGLIAFKRKLAITIHLKKEEFVQELQQ